MQLAFVTRISSRTQNLVILEKFLDGITTANEAPSAFPLDSRTLGVSNNGPVRNFVLDRAKDCRVNATGGG